MRERDGDERGETFCPACGAPVTENAADTDTAVSGKIRLKRRSFAESVAAFFIFLLVIALPTGVIVYVSENIFDFNANSEFLVMSGLAIFLPAIITIFSVMLISIRNRQVGLKNSTIMLLNTRSTVSEKENTYVLELLINHNNPADKKIDAKKYIKRAVHFYDKGRSRLIMKECEFAPSTLPFGNTKMICEVVMGKKIMLQSLHLQSGKSLVVSDIGGGAIHNSTVSTYRETLDYRRKYSVSKKAKVFRVVVMLVLFALVMIVTFWRRQLGF